MGLYCREWRTWHGSRAGALRDSQAPPQGYSVASGTRWQGQVTAKAKVTKSSMKGVVFMTFHFAESATNLLTNPALDPVSKIPELKFCAVRVEKVTEKVPA